MRNIQAEKSVSLLIEQIKKHRQDQELSLEALAKVAGIDRSTLGLIEKGKRIPTILTMFKLSMALGISLSGLISQVERRSK